MPKIEMVCTTKSMMSPSSGNQIGEGAPFFVTTKAQAQEYEEKGLGKMKDPSQADEPDAPSEEVGTTSAADPWLLQLDPETYLERWPDGPNASQAKAEIARRKASESGDKNEGGEE